MAKYIYTEEIDGDGTAIVCYKLGTKWFKWLSHSNNVDISFNEWNSISTNRWSKKGILSQYYDKVTILGEFNTLSNPIEVLYG